MNEAKQYVAEGLERRKTDRQTREQQLDNYEQQMIAFCNKHSADSKQSRTETEKRETYRALKAEKLEAMRRKDAAAEMACTKYGYACVAILLLSAWTPIPFYAAVALIAGLAVFPVAYIVKLYDLLGVKKK